MPSEEELRRKAEEIAKDKAGFYVHFGVYLTVNAFMVLIWYATSGGDDSPWFIFMTGGWGIGIVAHYLAVIVGPSKVEKMAQREYERLKAQK